MHLGAVTDPQRVPALQRRLASASWTPTQCPRNHRWGRHGDGGRRRCNPAAEVRPRSKADAMGEGAAWSSATGLFLP
jgi:hypothetical protein